MRGSTTVRLFQVVLVAFVLGMLGLGCATSTFVPTMAMEKPLNTYRAIYFSSESSVAEDITSDLFTFDEYAAKKLTKSKLFDVVNTGVCPTTCEKALILRANVTAIKKVSGGARFFLGIFAGSASMTATLTVTDGMTKETLGVYEVKGTTGSSGFAGTTKNAIINTATAIAKIMKEKHSSEVSAAPGS